MLFPENMEYCAKETQLAASQIKNQELAHLCFPSLDLFALLEFCYSYRFCSVSEFIMTKFTTAQKVQWLTQNRPQTT